MNYSELVALLPGYIGRPNDADITAKAPTFIALAEAKLNRRLRTRRQVTRTTISPSSETLAVPSDYAGLAVARLVDSPATQLTPVSAEAMFNLQGNTGGGSITHISLEGENFVFWPEPSSAVDIRLLYYARIPALTADAPTNWLIDDHLDAYLYGAALEAYLYLADAESVATYAQLLQTCVDDIHRAYVNEAPNNLTPQATVI